MKEPDSVEDRFRHAVWSGDAPALRALLEKEADARVILDRPLFGFDSPALVATQDMAIVRTLLEFGANPNRRSDWWAGGFHPLYGASPEKAEALLAAGAVPDVCAAAHLDRLDLIREMLDAEPARVHERGGDGQTPLHFARSRAAVDLLLERGADIDAEDVDHRSTPAQWMLERRKGAGRYELAQYLVDRGASADIFLAAALGLVDRVREIVPAEPGAARLRTGAGEYGEKPPSSFKIYTWTIGQYLSPLQVAEQFDQPEIVEILEPLASPKDLFLAACRRGDRMAAERWAGEIPGGDLGLTADEMKALPDAAWEGNAAAVDVMLGFGFDPAAAAESSGGTALHCAAWQGEAECIEVALRYPGARALIENVDRVHGSTPLGWCCHGARHSGRAIEGYIAVAKLLLAAGARPGPNLEDAPEELRAVLG